MCGKPTYIIGYIVTVFWCVDWSVWEAYLHDRIHSDCMLVCGLECIGNILT